MPVRQDKQLALQPPPTPLAIPYGKYLDIDQKYYESKDMSVPLEDIHSKGKTLMPHGKNVQLRSDFIQQPPPISLATGSLKVNYGSYIYQQKTGFDAAHSAGLKTQPTEVMFR